MYINGNISFKHLSSASYLSSYLIHDLAIATKYGIEY